MVRATSRKNKKKPAAKIDLYEQHKDEYVTPKTPVVVTIKPAKYLAISGQGAPGGERFTAAVGALYNVAFTIKMARKFVGKQDYAVSKLEGLWFLDPAEPPPARRSASRSLPVGSQTCACSETSNHPA